MPVKRRRRRPRSADATVSKRLARVEAQLKTLTGARVNVRREEHDEVLAALRTIEENARNLERHTRDLDIQFQRIAQLQADVDEIKRRR
jgi:hypothetical protein